MAANPRDILIRPIITEKTSVMMQDNKYTFKVPLDANKTEIRQAVESIWNVKVLNVTTIRIPGKARLFLYLKECKEGKVQWRLKATIRILLRDAS